VLFFAENASKPVWRQGSSPHPLAALRGWDTGKKSRGKAGEGGKGEGRGREENREEKEGILTVMEISCFRP